MTDINLPAAIIAGVTPAPMLARLRVVDVSTSAVITNVIDADAMAGKVRRYAVEDGNLVRDGDQFRVIEEDRAVRLEWIDPPVATPVEAIAAETE